MCCIEHEVAGTRRAARALQADPCVPSRERAERVGATVGGRDGMGLRHPTRAKHALDEFGEERLVVGDPGHRRGRSQHGYRHTRRGGQTLGQRPDLLRGHVGVDGQAMPRPSGVDDAVEHAVRSACARYGERSVVAADRQPAGVAELEPLPAVRFIVGIGRRHGGVQVARIGAHPCPVLVLLDARDFREKRDGRDVLEVQHPALRSRGRPAVFLKWFDLCVEVQPVGEIADGSGGRHVAARSPWWNPASHREPPVSMRRSAGTRREERAYSKMCERVATPSGGGTTSTQTVVPQGAHSAARQTRRGAKGSPLAAAGGLGRSPRW